MITDFFTKTFQVYRQVWTTDDDSNSYSQRTACTTFNGHLQQSSMELAQSMGLVFTKTFTIWCPLATSVFEGDELTYGGHSFTVRAKREFAVGNNQHLELVVERELIISA